MKIFAQGPSPVQNPSLGAWPRWRGAHGSIPLIRRDKLNRQASRARATDCLSGIKACMRGLLMIGTFSPTISAGALSYQCVVALRHVMPGRLLRGSG